jgi:GNAT superfamily N-acetyltransferase
MINSEYELRTPASDKEWRAFHDIRRKVLFENRGDFESYNENHPDDVKSGNHPLALLHKGELIGVIRVDVCEMVAWFRRVAIREDLQRLGHGRILLRLAEEFANAKGCNAFRSNVAIDAVGFYQRCGYERDDSRPESSESVAMWKKRQ